MDNPDDNNIWICSCLIASSNYCHCSRLYAKVVRIEWNISESIRSENIFRLRFHFGFHKCWVKLGRNSTKPSMVFRSAFMQWRTRTNWNANISIIFSCLNISKCLLNSIIWLKWEHETAPTDRSPFPFCCSFCLVLCFNVFQTIHTFTWKYRSFQFEWKHWCCMTGHLVCHLLFENRKICWWNCSTFDCYCWIYSNFIHNKNSFFALFSEFFVSIMSWILLGQKQLVKMLNSQKFKSCWNKFKWWSCILLSNREKPPTNCKIILICHAIIYLLYNWTCWQIISFNHEYWIKKGNKFHQNAIISAEGLY